MTDPVVAQAADLTKVYPARGEVPEFRAVDGIGFELRRGETFGFLGPNGAGKSTTMRMIAATSPRSGGMLRVLGMDLRTHGSAIRGRLGVVLVFGLVEPVMYLLTIGFGVGSLVGAVPGVNVRYPVFVAPAILATTAMNTAFNQTSFGVFSRIKSDLTYEAIIPTPLSATDIAAGEVASAVLNGLLTSIGFLLAATAMGLVTSPGILLALPAAALVGFAFAAAGLAVTTYLRDFSDFQLVQLVMLPMYLFATTFYPLSTYPGWLRPLIEALPLYQSIQLIRGPALGHFDVAALTSATCYLAVFGGAGMIIATRRLGKLLLK